MEIYQFRCKTLIDNGLTYDELENYTNFEDVFSKQEFECIIREKHNRRNKRYRTKSKFIELYRIASLIENQNKKIVFGTITLDNKNLNKKEDTYIRKINKWLKNHFIYSILNKDFGNKTEREHYHFIGLTIEDIETKNSKSKKGYEIFELKNKDYGMGFEPTLCIIDLNKNDIQKTVNYLLKLNNHSNKITTKNRIRIVKNGQYKYLAMLTGFEATKAEKVAKKSMVDNM
jgi:hypothetical protein